MRLLLDTHIWLWSLLEPQRLGPRTRAAIEDPDCEQWLSPISVWETLMLAERGRVALDPDPEAWVRNSPGHTRAGGAVPRRGPKGKKAGSLSFDGLLL